MEINRKILFLFVVFSFLFQTGNSQFLKNDYFFISGELGVGNYFGADLNLNIVFKQNISLSTGYSSYVRSAKTKPDDYYVGDLAVLMFYTIPGPKDKITSYQIFVGKVLNFKTKKKIRLNPSVGIGYSEISYPTQWEYKPTSSLSSNYTYKQKSTRDFSLIIKPKFEILLTRLFGFSVSPTFILGNKDNVYLGINAGIIFGKMRNKN